MICQWRTIGYVDCADVIWLGAIADFADAIYLGCGMGGQELSLVSERLRVLGRLRRSIHLTGMVCDLYRRCSTS